MFEFYEQYKTLKQKFAVEEGMTKEEAIIAMHEGKKVRHRNFTPEEWVKKHDEGRYEFEDGVICTVEMFWKDREAWNSGWSIVNDI